MHNEFAFACAGRTICFPVPAQSAWNRLMTLTRHQRRTWVRKRWRMHKTLCGSFRHRSCPVFAGSDLFPSGFWQKIKLSILKCLICSSESLVLKWHVSLLCTTKLQGCFCFSGRQDDKFSYDQLFKIFSWDEDHGWSMTWLQRISDFPSTGSHVPDIFNYLIDPVRFTHTLCLSADAFFDGVVCSGSGFGSGSISR